MDVTEHTEHRIAEPAAVYNVQENAALENSEANRFRVRGFQPGYDPRRNTLGRIQKTPTVLDETVRLAHKAKQRKKIARAWVETMSETGTAAGNRARSDFSDRAYGLPKQTLVLEQGDSPLTALFAHLAEQQALPAPYIDGESKQVDST